MAILEKTLCNFRGKEMIHYYNFTNKTIQLVPVSGHDQDCNSCAISALQCGNCPDHCSKPEDSIWVFAEGSADPIDVYIGKIKTILTKYKMQYFNVIDEDESFTATILQKSLKYSNVKLRIFKINSDGVIILHEDTLSLEEEIKTRLFDIVRKMPDGTILNARTYKKSINMQQQKVQVIDFTIKRVFTL